VQNSDIETIKGARSLLLIDVLRHVASTRSNILNHCNMFQSAVLVLLAGTAAFAAPASYDLAERASTTSIDAAYKAHGKKYWGNIADPNTLSISQNTAILKADFGMTAAATV
jgi:hypothetical protein